MNAGGRLADHRAALEQRSRGWRWRPRFDELAGSKQTEAACSSPHSGAPF